MSNIESLKQKTIFVSVMGSPNAGKSTLANAMAGSKISIVTPKVQTTRNNIKAIITEDEVQIILTDTPGIFNPKQTLEKSIVKTAWQGIKNADMLALVLDCRRALDEENMAIINYIKEEKRPCILVLNKIDKVEKLTLLPLVEQLSKLANFTAIFMVSALKKDGIKDLKKFIASQAKLFPWPCNPDEITDMPIKVWAAEVVREKLFFRLSEELPYNIAVETESYKLLSGGGVRVDVVIYVSKESQKKIVLGKQGSLIKQVGTDARKELSYQLGKNIQLFLFVKVRENWQEDNSIYRDFGMELPN